MSKLYRKFGLCWEIARHHSVYNEPEATPICPASNCHCSIIEDDEYFGGSLKAYGCKCVNPECGFKLKLDRSLEDNGITLIEILKGQEYKNYDIIDLDGELIPINERKKIQDDDYWVDAKISKNKKGEKQLMVLAGSKKTKDKTQLFLDSSHERLGFDQNDSHPKEVFSQVIATFKHSESKLSDKKQ